MPENVACKWCGMEMPADADKCPWCYRAPPPATPPPTPPAANDAPPDPVIGQEEFGTLASLRSLARYDPAMFAVLVVLALYCVLSLIWQDWLGLIITTVVLLGIIQWTRWAFWLVVVIEGLSILWGVPMILGLGLLFGGVGAALGVARLAISLFVFVTVVLRRDRFD